MTQNDIIKIIKSLPKSKSKTVALSVVILLSLALTISGIDQFDQMELGTASASNKSQQASVVTAIPKDLSVDDIFIVKRVVDGDTLVLRPANSDATEFKVRLIGIDTPESVDPRKSVECFGKEASAYTKSVAEGKSVKLEIDKSQGETDRYGRLLAYVFVQSEDRGEESLSYSLNERLISDGYAHEYTYQKTYKYQADFKLAQKDAEYAGRGLWASDACVKN